MWKAFSLRARLAVLLCAILLVVLIVSALLLRAFSLNQIVEENEPGARSAQLVALGLNEVLRVSPDPRRALDAFAAGLNTSGREGLRFESRSVDAREAHRIQTPQSPFVPDWFVSIVGFPKIGEHIPVFIASERVGDIVYEPDVSADIYEKWMGFLALALAAVGLAGITLAGAYFLLGRTVRSLDVLSNGLTRLRAGDYSTPIVPFGPPEIRRSSEEANALALTLAQLKTDNRNLLRRMISMQDDERGYIARELHDELGPLLFGVRANAVAFLESTTSHDRSPAAPQLANKIMECAESLQQASRRILDRLRPLHIDELGLQESIQALLRDAAANAPELKISSKIDSNLPSESVAS